MTKIYILKNNTEHYDFAKQLAAEEYNIEKSTLILSKGPHGKPFFKNLPNFHFNISHSGELKVIAVSDSNIGIDIEKLRTPNLSVTRRFCEDEYTYVTQNASPTAFFEVWTKKEAYLKYLGEGLHAELNSFSVFRTDTPIKTFKKGDYIISVCGTENFEIIE